MKLKWLCLAGFVLALLQPVSAEYAEITIDGDFSDWNGIPSITNDPLDHIAGGVDFKEMWVANDDDYLYIRYTLHVPANLLVWNVRIFIDGDNDPNTGYHPENQDFFGAEIGVEHTTGLQQAGGSFHEGVLTNAFIERVVSPSGVSTQLEFCISRAVTGVSNAYAGVSLIANDTIRLLLQDDRKPNYDYMPDTHGVAYTFAPSPPPPSYYKEIMIDGVFSDWEGVPSVATTPANNPNGIDWKELWVANDAEYLYIKYTLHASANPFIWYTHFFFDGDNKKNSGFNVGGLGDFGSEFMVEGVGVFQQAGGEYNEGSPTNAGLKQSSIGIKATEFEFRFARAVTGVSGSFSNQLLLASDTIRILALDETNDNRHKYMPHTRGAVYAFAPDPPPGGTLIQIK